MSNLDRSFAKERSNGEQKLLGWVTNIIAVTAGPCITIVRSDVGVYGKSHVSKKAGRGRG